jgi:hypothetical protein
MLAKITIGWHWLERTLNAIIEEVNQQRPLGSSTIAIEESPNGTLVKVVGQQAQAQGGGGGPTGGSWQQLAVIDDSSGTCVTKYIWLWGTQPTLAPTEPPV